MSFRRNSQRINMKTRRLESWALEEESFERHREREREKDHRKQEGMYLLHQN